MDSSLTRKSQSLAMAAAMALMFGGPAAAQAPTGTPDSSSVSAPEPIPGAPDETPAADAAETPLAAIEEVFVTARRREEKAQDAPLSVSVLDANALERLGVNEISDVTQSVPGINLTASGGSFNTIFNIRGMSRGVFGNVQPAAAAYLNEVPLSTWGTSIPTYDMSSVQVLKGPQGTLFGRNTTAGALLVTTQKPTEKLGGYLSGTYGSYNWRQLEGAVNVPMLDNRLIARVAGQLLKRDGYTDNMVKTNRDFDDRDRQNLRVSLLATPIEGLSNLAVYEVNTIDEVGSGVVFSQYTPGGAVDGVPYYNGTILITQNGPVPCNGDPRCDITAVAARQDAAGERKAWSSADPFLDGLLTSFINTTSYALGPVTLKNIFGYRAVNFDSRNDIDGTDLPIIDAQTIVHMKQYTEEFQVSGEALDNTLSYIGGVFYSNSKPAGNNRLALQLFAHSGTPMTSQSAPPFNGAFGNGDYFYDKSKAVFAQASYKLSGINEDLAAFTVDAGVRYTKDKSRVCDAPSQSAANKPISSGDCSSAPGGTTTTADFDKTTYTLGLNYKLNEQTLIYGVTRTGYRAGGLNTPVLGGTLTPLQTYDPETVQDVELGLKGDWKLGHMPTRFNLALYQSKYKDLLATVSTAASPDPDGDGNPANNPNGTTLNVNAGEATVEGAEVELSIIPVERVEVALGASWLDRKIDKLTLQLPPTLPASAVSKEGVEGFAFLGAPDYSYTATLSYNLPLSSELGGMRASAKYFRISDVEYGGVKADAYDTLDLRFDWLSVMQSSFDAALFVSNVTDETGIIGPGSSSEGTGFSSAIYTEPRMVGAQIRYSFGD